MTIYGRMDYSNQLHLAPHRCKKTFDHLAKYLWLMIVASALLVSIRFNPNMSCFSEYTILLAYKAQRMLFKEFPFLPFVQLNHLSSDQIAKHRYLKHKHKSNYICPGRQTIISRVYINTICIKNITTINVCVCKYVKNHCFDGIHAKHKDSCPCP